MSNTSTTNDDEEIKPPKVTGAPARIWLVYGDIERDSTHDECSRMGDVGWCEDKQFDSDVEYVRADALTAQAATIERLEAENVRLQPLADEWARLSQDEGKAEREIERLRSDTVRWIAFRRIWPVDESGYDMFFNALAVAKNPDEVDAVIDAAMQAGKAVEE